MEIRTVQNWERRIAARTSSSRDESDNIGFLQLHHRLPDLPYTEKGSPRSSSAIFCSDTRTFLIIGSNHLHPP